MTIAKDVSQSINDTAKAISKIQSLMTALTNAQTEANAALSDLQTVATDLQDILNDITPAPPPTASFTLIANGLSVIITDTSNNVSSEVWNFGDGSTSNTDGNQQHSYAQNGTYTITLVVTGANGNTANTEQSVTVAKQVAPPSPPPPPPSPSGLLDTSTFLYKYVLEAVTPTVSASVPTVGAPWVCPQSGAPIMRLTDYTKMPGAPSDLTGVCSDYSRFPVFSKDNAYLYINGVGGNEVSWLYHFASNTYIGPLKAADGSSLGENNLIRWDNSGNRNHVFYYVLGTALYEKDLDAGTDTLIRDFVKDFPGIQQITNGVEGDVSLDGTIFAFMGQVYTGGYWTSPHIFTYNRATNTILGVYPNPITNPETSSPNMIDPVPDSSGVVIDWGVKQGTAADQDGAHYYPLNFDVSKAVKVGHGEEHSGWGMNKAGVWGFVSQDNSTDNFIWCSMTGGYNGADMIILGNLSEFGYKEQGNFHFGKVTVPGWIPIFTDHTGNAQPGDNQILMMPLAPNATPLLGCLSYNISDTSHYYSQFFPSATLDGTLIAGAANYDTEEGAHQDVFLYGLPSDWATHAAE